MSTDYADAYRNVNFRDHPEKYKIGKGEQGVLMAEPYKSEILPFWKFRTPEIASESAKTIYSMFIKYGEQNDFVGMDMARKFLQMGWTRSRRYANHPSGRKYGADGAVLPQDNSHADSDKAKSAQIFRKKLELALKNETYIRLTAEHKKRTASVT